MHACESLKAASFCWRWDDYNFYEEVQYDALRMSAGGRNLCPFCERNRDVLSCPMFSVSSPAFRPLVIISCQCAPFITISHPSNPILKLAQITFRIKRMGGGIT